MQKEPDYDAEMKLPEGRLCGDCFAVRFCAGIGCTTPASTKCDYWPNRFRVGPRALYSPLRRPPYEPPRVELAGNLHDVLAYVCAGGDCDLED